MTTARHLTLETHDGRAQLRATPVLPAGEHAESIPRPSAEVVLPGAARIDLRMPGAGELEFSSAGSPGVVLRWSPSEIVLDRFAHSEVHPEFPSAERMPLPEDPGAVTIVVDTTSIEVFAAGGLRTLTDLVAWQGPVSIRVAEGNVEGLTVADLVPAAQNAPVVVIGESLIDVVDRNSRLSRHVGGSPLNVAYGLGRLGIPALFATEFAGDSDGAAIADHLAAAGVSIHMTSGAAERTATAIAHLGPDGSASYEFDVDWRFETPPTATQAEAVHVGSVGALRSPGGDRVLAYIEALPDDVLITFDPNIRPAVMPARERTRALVERYAARAAVVKLSDEDAAWLYPGETDVASRLLGLGARLVAITRGAEGSQLHTPSASVRVGSVPVRTVDTIGAGDAYMTGLIGAILTEIGTSVVLSGDLTQSDLERIGEVAALAAGLTVARAGAQPPTGNELALGGGILSAAR